MKNNIQNNRIGATNSSIVICCFLLITLCFTACDLFNPTDPDMLAKIDAEIAWANAARLNITVAYPQFWGTSLQRGTGRAGDTRVGYEFDIDFTPSPDYSFLNWLAYDTKKLNAAFPNWINNANVITEDKINEIFKLNALHSLPVLEGIELPQFDLGGGTGRVKVTNDSVLDITLIPVSREQPRIIRSTPDNNTGNYKNNGKIEIVFASSIRGDRVIFGNNNIMIFSQEYDSETNTYGPQISMPFTGVGAYYSSPTYNDNLKTITINSRNGGPKLNSLITLYLGDRITNTNGRPLKPVEIKWKANEETLQVINPYAYYVENEDKIVVEWDTEGSVFQTVVSWMIDDVMADPIILPNSDIRKYEITGIPKLVYNDPDSLIRYDIMISLINAAGSVSDMSNDLLMIINSAGSESSGGAEYTLVYNVDDLRNARLNEKILLMKDLENVTNWTPLGRNSPFTGIFYGFGHTITVNSFASGLGNNASYGIFWHINNAKFFNLELNYPNSNIVQLADVNHTVNAGGLAGIMNGTNIIEDCNIENGFWIRAFQPTNEYMSVLWTDNGQRHGWGASIQLDNTQLDNTNINKTYSFKTQYAFWVHDFGNDGPGTLRDAFALASTGATIILDGVTAGSTTIDLVIPLELPLNRTFIVEGNGVIIQPVAGWTSNATSQLLRVNNETNLTINRVHFRNGRSTNSGSAIRNHGTLTLNSCIFSGNETNGENTDGTHGGAIRNENYAALTVIGCTFYNNKVIQTGSGDPARGAAIYNTGRSLTITGNIFYGNNSYSNDSHIIYGNTNLISGGHNIVDRALGTGRYEAGFNVPDSSDATTADWGLTGGHGSGLSWGSTGNVVEPSEATGNGNDRFVFGPNPFTNTDTSGNDAFRPRGNTLQTHIPASWASTNNMPATDFYGNPRRHTFSGTDANRAGAPGAVERP